MGKKGNWFSVVKKALSPDSKNKKEKKSNKSKKWFGKQKSLDPDSLSGETAELDVPLAPPPPPATPDAKLAEVENEQSKHAYTVEFATAVAAAQAVRLTSTVSRFSGKSKEEISAIKIQTAFRGYLARRALRALRGLVRLKSFLQGQSLKRQATTTLRCMQTLARVQSQIHTRRMRMLEEHQALQRQLQQKREQELEKYRVPVGEEWNDSAKSKEEVEATLQSRQEAAIRRERALAYAYSHQQLGKNYSKSSNPTFVDPNNPHWGWSWLERWMAAHPRESRSTLDTNDRSSLKSSTSGAISIREISKSHYLRDNKTSPTGPKLSRPPSRRRSPSTPRSKAPSTSSVTGMTKQASLRGIGWEGNDGTRSTFSVQSDRYLRHSIATSSVRDDESLASSVAAPSYMAAAQSAKVKSRASPLGLDKNETPEKGSVGAKKRLAFRASSAGQRRHSGPPRMETGSIKDVVVQMEERLSND